MASIWPSGKAVAARTCGWWKIFKLMRYEKGLPSDKVKAVLLFSTSGWPAEQCRSSADIRRVDRSGPRCEHSLRLQLRVASRCPLAREKSPESELESLRHQWLPPLAACKQTSLSGKR